MFFSRISFKLAVMIGLSLAGIIALAPLALYSIRKQMMTDRQAKIQQMVELGHGILAHYQKLESGGKLSREQAQAAALAEIKELRYDKVEFFWINDMAPNMVMSPTKPELDGKPVGEFKDPAGNHLFRALSTSYKSRVPAFTVISGPRWASSSRSASSPM